MAPPPICGARPRISIHAGDEGGRHKPFSGNYSSQFYFRISDVTGTVTLKDGSEMVMPGDSAELPVELMKPVAIEEKSRSAIREGDKTVGASIRGSRWLAHQTEESGAAP